MVQMIKIVQKLNSSMMTRLDIVIFGATGYTGKIVIEELCNIQKKTEKVTWGVAGRNKNKLKEFLQEISIKTDTNLNDVALIEANVNDKQSLSEMAKKSKVVISCVGPYRHYGEQVVNACVSNGAHHIDVSGEPQYMERMQLLFHKKAEENKVYVVSGCGFDSVVADMGVLYFLKQFQNGEANSLETYLRTIYEGPESDGSTMNYATWESALYGLAHANELKPLRKQLYPNRLPETFPKLESRGVIHRYPNGKGWCLPFIGSDLPVMRRSQYYYHDVKHQRPLQIHCYVVFPSIFRAVSTTLLLSIIYFINKFSIGRSLLLKYPEFFTLGFISRVGPKEDDRKNTTFELIFNGEGWTEKCNKKVTKQPPPNLKITTKLSGTDPAYGLAARIAVLCAMTILEESDKMPGWGGVYSPGAAFCDTSLLHKLNTLGEVNMEVVNRQLIAKL